MGHGFLSFAVNQINKQKQKQTPSGNMQKNMLMPAFWHFACRRASESINSEVRQAFEEAVRNGSYVYNQRKTVVTSTLDNNLMKMNSLTLARGFEPASNKFCEFCLTFHSRRQLLHYGMEEMRPVPSLKNLYGMNVTHVQTRHDVDATQEETFVAFSNKKLQEISSTLARYRWKKYLFI